MKEQGLNVLSLFDGISTGRLALERAGIKVNLYLASEIDTRAIKISRANWGDDVVQLGDVNKIDVTALPKIDLLIAGSPCQGFSREGKCLNFNDPRSMLFFKFVEVLEALRLKNPDVKFLLENVNMKHEWRDIITQHLGVEPVLIDSRKKSGAARERIYWTNIWEIPQPEDMGVKLLDVLDADVKVAGLIEHEGIYFDPAFSEASRSLVQVVDGEVRVKQATQQGYIVAENGDSVNLGFPNSKTRRGRVVKQKAPTLTCSCNFGVFINGVIRKPTAEELEKLQTLPVGYTKFYKEDDGTLKEAPYTARENAIGNGWTTDVIAHIFSGLKENDKGVNAAMDVIPKKVLKLLERRRKAAEQLGVASGAVDEYCKSIGLTPDVYGDSACLCTNILIYTEASVAKRITKEAIEKALTGRLEEIEPWNA